MRLAYLIALIWLLSPQIAHAGPVVLALGGTAFWAGVANVALMVGSVIYGSAQQRRQQRAAKDAYNASLRDRTVTVVTADAPFRYVYGRARAGSLIINMLKSGDKDQYKHLVCVHAAHECDAIEEIYIAGKALGPLDGSGGVTTGDYVSTKTQLISEFHTGISFDLDYEPTNLWVVVDYGGDNGQEIITPVSVVGKTVTLDQDYGLMGGTVHCTYQITITTPRVRVQKHLGVPGDQVDAYLHGLLPDEWTTTDTVDGYCYTVITLDLNQPEFQTGIPSIEVLLRGKKLYDLRTGITAWSQNPALAIRDYLMSEMCGVDPADIPDADVIAAANVCDTVVSGASVDGSGPLYTLNGAVSAEQDQSTVLEQMAQAMAGGIVATTWRMWAGAYTAPVLALDETDIVGQIAITPGMSDADIYNGVKGQFIGATNSYVATDFPPYQNATYVAADGGQEKWTNIDLLWTDDPQRCANLARIFTEDQRNGYTVKADFSLKTWGVQIGERVTLSSALFGWSSKIFRVTDKEYSPTSAVTLTLKEDDPSIWDLADAVTPDSTPNTNLASPYAIAPLATLTCSSGDDELLLQADGTIISRIRATWPAATTQAVLTNGLIEVEWLKIGDTVWNKTQVSGSELDAYLSPVQDGYYYVIRVRTVNPYFNVKSDWIYTFHQVIGKSALPPDVTGFGVSQMPDATRSFSWTTTDQPVDVLHGGGYRIRYRTAGASTAWADMTQLHTGLLTQEPFETRLPAPGDYDFAISAVDGSGNESANAAIIPGVTITDASTASDALAAAQAAQADATSALDQLTTIGNDAVLSRGEKPAVIVDYNEIINTQPDIDAKADAFGQSRSEYDTAVTKLTTYLGGLAPAWNDTTQDTPIPEGLYVSEDYWPRDYAGDGLRSFFNDVYWKRQRLLNAIAAEAGKRATWDGVVNASGKLSTGAAIFNGGAIGTDDMAGNSATDIIATTASAVDCNPQANVATIIYAAIHACVVELSAKGDSSNASGGAGGQITFVETPVMSISAVDQNGTTVPGSISVAPAHQSNSSGPFDLDLTMLARFSLDAGMTYTFKFSLYTRASSSHGLVNNLIFSMTAIKR